MRLSNLFIYGSLSIVVSLSIGYLLFKAFAGATDSDSSSPQELTQRVADLEMENQELLEKSENTIDNLSKKITSLNDDLHRSSQLVMEKDNEIAQLNSRFDSNKFHAELGTLLNCRPADVPATVANLVKSFQDMQLRFQLVNQQLAVANDSLAKARSNQGKSQDPVAGNPGVPLAKPENHEKETRDTAALDQQQVTQHTPETNRDLETLQAQVESLKNALRNREKLLYEQTSLIEDLKKKNNRIETGLRTGKNANDSVPANSPFRDRGTFRVKN